MDSDGDASNTKSALYIYKLAYLRLWYKGSGHAFLCQKISNVNILRESVKEC